jgi:hypothetical protein
MEVDEINPFEPILTHMRSEPKPNFLQVKLAIDIYALQHDVPKEVVIKTLLIVLKHLEDLFHIESYTSHLKQ